MKTLTLSVSKKKNKKKTKNKKNTKKNTKTLLQTMLCQSHLVTLQSGKILMTLTYLRELLTPFYEIKACFSVQENLTKREKQNWDMYC